MTSGPSSFRFGAFEVDVRAAELRRGDEKVDLQEQPFQVLLLLLEHPGEVVTRDELRRRLWPADTFVDFDQGLNAAIHRLRHALEDSAEAPRFIETIPRHGYRFLAKVEAAPSPGKRRFWRRAPGLKVAVAAVLAALSIVSGSRLYDRLWPTEPRPRISAIAVLPLDNLSGDPAQEYLADGLTEALITELARTMPLRVVSRTSSMAYKGRRMPLKQIARDLGVDGAVEGALVRSGTRWRVTVQLVAVATDRHLWAESFERDEADVIALQGDVALAVAREIGVHVSPRRPRGRRVDPEAARLYLEGRYFYGRWPEGLDRAVERFEKAVARDPSFAAALGSLAMCEVDRSFSRPPGEALERGRQAALRALAVEDVAAAHAALGGVRMFRDWDWEGAETELRRAVELDPSASEARIWYANLLTAVGRHDEALAEAVRARERDPVSILASLNVGWTLTKARRYEEAVVELRRALELDPNFALTHEELAWCYTHQGRFPEAFAEFDRVGRDPNDPFLGFLYGVSGRRDEALAVARRLERQASTRYVSPYDVAVAYAGAGGQEAALSWLGRALDERAAHLFLLKVDPWWDGLRGDPRFHAYLGRMGFEP